MQTLIYISIGVVIGYFGFKALKGGNKTRLNFSMEKFDSVKNRINRKEKRGDINKKILELVGEKERITNNDIEKLLNVADSTATKYLQRLEDEGKIIQHGKTGKYTYYTLK